MISKFHLSNEAFIVVLQTDDLGKYTNESLDIFEIAILTVGRPEVFSQGM